MCLKQVKRREKIALASMLSVVMLMSGFAGVAKASTEGVYTYKNNTGQISGSTFVNKKTGKSYVEELR